MPAFGEVQGGPGSDYAVAPDDQRFVMVRQAEQDSAAAQQINVVLNWFEELKQRVPVQ